jgi:hypothetical protein
VRLGIVQRAQGKAQASAAAFKKAMASPGRDAVVTRLLALAVGGVAPDEARWDEDWPKVRLATGGDEPAIVWPGPNPKGVREAFPSDPVTFDLDDVSLTAFLNCFLGLNRFMEDLESAQEIRRRFPGFENWPLSYKVPATVQKMDFVIHTDVQQYRPDTFAPEAARVSITATCGGSGCLRQGAWPHLCRPQDRPPLPRRAPVSGHGTEGKQSRRAPEGPHSASSLPRPLCDRLPGHLGLSFRA